MFADALKTLKKEFCWKSISFRHAVKAAIAITVAIVAARFLELRHAVWLPISVIVIMRPSVGGTLRIGWKRLWGTVLGASLGVGILFLEPATAVLVSLIALSFFLVIVLRVFSYTAFSCFLTVAVVLLLGVLFTDGWQFGVERILDTFLGVIIGVVASFGVWPNLARKNLRKKIGTLVELQKSHFMMLSESYLKGGITEAELVESRIKASVQLDQCREFFREAAAEPGLQGWQRSELTRLLRTFTRMHSLLISMSTIIRRGYGGPLPSIADGMKKILSATTEYYAWLECYALTPDECSDQPDFDKAIDDFMIAVGDARIKGDFEDVPIERRNNISAFIWNIRALGGEITRAGKRLHELRYGRG
ncbi:FUSC family protein [Maridesulfovibrio hydrothermalis]|uniref:Putative membrane protein n=1 Tax=Maridesulfovibrio hydrothermalis AM13 = DSM 14728 TaxID=1121451 RepID=L0R674_9BACT|nr:FUSC family protein [Maridesulfovibrio hydrothermalis]CCO22193.1 putative membrane protein [Maridesulfovibrio hydrothermalis AM13 = DSM 14728]